MTVTQLIAATAQWQLQRTFAPYFNQTLLVQQLNYERAASLNEYHLYNVQQLSQTYFLTYVHSELQGEQTIVYYEDFDGVALSSLSLANYSSKDIYYIAQQIVEACYSVHQQQLVFRQLNPAHILVNTETLQVKLVPSSAFLNEAVIDRQQSLEHLQFIAPEQTGRIDLEQDERVDLYALGAIFYRLLAPSLFDAQQRDELLLQIVTKMPNMDVIQQQGYEQFADMIAKLLMKNPSDRYQSVVALKHDLSLLQNGKLQQLAYGEQLFMPKAYEGLCGREQELQQMVEAFAAVAKGGKRCIVVNGPAGMGKTRLIEHVKPKAIEAGSFFVTYKFEERQQNELEVITAPLRQLFKQLYFKGHHTVALFQEQLQQQHVMITDGVLQLLPELRVLLHESIEIVEGAIDFTMQQNTYLFTAIKQLLDVIAMMRKPIVFLFDDCQWASKQSIDNIMRIYEQHTAGYIGVICTARDEQHMYIHELSSEQEHSLSVITIAPLQREAVYNWLQQSIFMDKTSLAYVAEKLYVHTTGNPLFLKEVFHALVKQQAFMFKEQEQLWVVNEPLFLQVVEKNNVIDFIIGRIQFLSPEAQRLLQIASTIGPLFPKQILQQLAHKEMDVLEQELEELVFAGFIVESEQSYRGLNGACYQFVHDRIHETVYGMLPKDEKLQLHYAIAQFLVSLQNRELVLAITLQYQLSETCITREEQLQLMDWNYELGLQSKNAGLYEEALQFFLTSESLRQKLDLQQYAQMTNLYMYIGECSFLAGQYEQSEQYIQQALLYAKTSLEKLKIYRIMTFLYFESQHSDVVLQAGYLAFEECGIAVPKNPKKQHVLQEYVKLKWALRNKSNEVLLELRPMEHEEIDVLIQIIVNLISSSFRMDSNLTGILLLKSMRLMLKYGVIAESAIVFVNYALVLAAGFNDIKGASRFGTLALQLADQQNNAYIKMRVYFAYGTFIHYWQHDYDGSKHYLQLAQHLAKQCGIPSIVNAASCFIVTFQLLEGKPLAVIDESIRLEQRKDVDPIVLAKDYLRECSLWTEALQQPTSVAQWHYPFELKHEHAVVVMHHILRLQMSYFWREEQQAKENLAVLQVATEATLNLMTAPTYFVYRSLWQYNWIHAKACSDTELKQYVAQLKTALRKFKKWAANAPQIYEHLYFLLQAEHYHLAQQFKKAHMYFEQAIYQAQLRGFIVDEAIIQERFAKFLQAQQQMEKAAYYEEQALQLLGQWGATAIVQTWQQSNAKQMKQSAKTDEQALLQTVLATTQALAQQRRIEQILAQSLSGLLTQCNATACYFIQQNGQQLQAIAKLESEQSSFAYTPEGEPLTQTIEFVAQFVMQCDEPVLIDDVKQHPLFANEIDDVHSILCLPVYHDDQILAVLYLENRVLAHAFNDEQQQLVQMVTTQLAISIENATIYENLEQRVAQRTQQYEEVAAHLMDANRKLEQKEQERNKLFSVVAEQLREPLLVSLQQIDEVLQDYAEQHIYSPERLAQSKVQIADLGTLITDVIHFVQLEASSEEFQWEQLSVPQLVQAMKEMFNEPMTSRGVTLVVHNEVHEDNYLKIDKKAMQLVFANLFANALQLTTAKEIFITVIAEDEQLICHITNMTSVLSEQQQQELFEHYFMHDDQSVNVSIRISLSVCRQILEHHGGQFVVMSDSEQGTTFTITLPIA